jgi:hypothetical protein
MSRPGGLGCTAGELPLMHQDPANQPGELHDMAMYVRRLTAPNRPDR